MAIFRPMFPPGDFRWGSGPVSGLVGAAIEHANLLVGHRLVEGQGLGLELALRYMFRLEMLIGVLAAHQRRPVPLSHCLLQPGRDVADRKTYAPVVGAIGLRSMEQQDVMQRRLARLQLGKHRLRLVDLDGDFLTTRQQVVLVESVLVLDLLLVGACHEFHAAGHLVGGRHRNPCGRYIGRIQPPIGRILMPGYKAGITRLLDEEAGVPAQNVRTQYVLDRIQNFGMPDHVVDPGKQHVAAVAHLALDRAARPRLIILELAAEFSDLALAQNIDREMIAALAVVLDLALAEHFRHAHSPAFSYYCGQKPMAKGGPALPLLSRSAGGKAASRLLSGPADASHRKSLMAGRT